MAAITFLSGDAETPPAEAPSSGSPRLSVRGGLQLLRTPSSEAGVQAYHRALTGAPVEATTLLNELTALRDGLTTRFELLAAIAVSPEARARGVSGPGLMLIRLAAAVFRRSGLAARVRRRRAFIAQAQSDSRPGAGALDVADLTRRLVVLEGMVIRLENRLFAKARAQAADPALEGLQARVAALELELRSKLLEEAGGAPIQDVSTPLSGVR